MCNTGGHFFLLPQNNQQLKDNNMVSFQHLIFYKSSFLPTYLYYFRKKFNLNQKLYISSNIKPDFYSGFYSEILKEYTYNVKFAVFWRPNLPQNKKLQDSFEFL